MMLEMTSGIPPVKLGLVLNFEDVQKGSLTFGSVEFGEFEVVVIVGVIVEQRLPDLWMKQKDLSKELLHVQSTDTKWLLSEA